MEFGKRLQMLRKQKGLTQDELAQSLFVSRTAVSKWESGRGYPNIDSLKAIAEFFSVTIDELLSTEETDKSKETSIQQRIFVLLDCSVAVLFFLPFFAQGAGGRIEAVSLLRLVKTASYLKTMYFLIVTGMLLIGVLNVALQKKRLAIWQKNSMGISMALNTAGAVLFIISSQVYAAVFLFAVLMIKAFMLLRWQ